MREFASRLTSQRHYESAEIKEREQAVLQRRKKVKRSAAERRSKLEDCRKLTVFLQNCNEVCGWVWHGYIHHSHITMVTYTRL